MIRVWIEGKPVPQSRPRFTKQGHAYEAKASKEYKKAVAIAAKEAMAGQEPLAGAIRVRMTAYFDIPKSWPKKMQQQAMVGELLPILRPDLDNLAKSVLDGMSGIVFTDDSQITDLEINKRYTGDGAGVVAWIGKL